MKRKPYLACFLAVIVPGSCHIYLGKKWIGIAILLGVIITDALHWLGRGLVLVIGAAREAM
jgi:hypothetical protein